LDRQGGQLSQDDRVNVAIFAGLFIDNPWHLPPDTWRLPSEDGQLSQDDRENVAIFAELAYCESPGTRRLIPGAFPAKTANFPKMTARMWPSSPAGFVANPLMPDGLIPAAFVGKERKLFP
jgi:hypothetical protein